MIFDLVRDFADVLDELPGRFVEAEASAPQQAAEALAYFRKLCQVERELTEPFAADDDAGRQHYRCGHTKHFRQSVDKAKDRIPYPVGAAVPEAV